MTVEAVPTEAMFYDRLGRRIRSARHQRGMSQQALADALDFESYVSVSHWESGAQRPSLYTLTRLEAVLGVRLHDC